jgi:hypothetical protein
MSDDFNKLNATENEKEDETYSQQQ